MDYDSKIIHYECPTEHNKKRNIHFDNLNISLAVRES